MKKCILRIIDRVNCKFEGVDAFTRRKLVETLKFFNPNARHTPSFRLGRWDGKVPFATVGGGTYINLLDRALPIIFGEGYEVDIVDETPEISFSWPEVNEDFLADRCWPDGHPAAGQPIMLRDYQVEAIRRYLANPRSLQSISTGAGKTILTACLSKLCEAYGRTIVIVPNKSLVEQTEEDYRNVGLDVGVFYGDRKEWNHMHTICTWQSLAIFAKKTRQGDVEIPIGDFLDGVVGVFVDEAHSAKADLLRDLLAGPFANLPICWGMTGTVPKHDFEFMTLLSTIGPVVGEIKAVTLQERGVLAKCHVQALQLDDDHVAFDVYHDEVNYTTADAERLGWIAQKCTEIAESGNTLILVERIPCGKTLRDLIPGAVFINGTVKSKDRKKEYKAVASADGKIIIATYGVAAVGINIPRIFNLVLIEAGKSFTRVIQSVGRGIRIAEDKDFVQIYDICSSLKFSNKHLGERKKLYNEAKYPFNVSKVSYRTK
jgi:superfamily II DNA or RNA helicase